jgi:PPOX class probable F420-dependent enzyme
VPVPHAPLPPELHRFLEAPRRAVVATLTQDGAPVTTETWYEWADGRLLLNMDAAGRRAANLRRDPRVAITVLATEHYTQLSLLGRAVELREDPDYVDIDRLSMRYDGKPYEPRDWPSLTAIVEIDRWHTWGDPAAVAR